MAETLTLEAWCKALNAIDPQDFVHYETGEPIADATFSSDVFDAPLTAIQFLKTLSKKRRAPYRKAKFKDSDLAQVFASLSPEDQRDAIVAATAASAAHGRFLAIANYSSSMRAYEEVGLLGYFVAGTISVKQPWDEATLSLLMECLSGQNWIGINCYLKVLEAWVQKNEWSKRLEQAKCKLAESYFPTDDDEFEYAQDRKLRQRLEKLGTTKPVSVSGAANVDVEPALELRACDSWTTAAIGIVEQLSGSEKKFWLELLLLSKKAKSSKPTKSFLKQSAELVKSIGTQCYIESMVAILDSVGTAFDKDVRHKNTSWSAAEATLVNLDFADVLRGLVWTTSFVDDKALLTSLASTADRCFQKIRGIGPRAPKIGNACLWVFANSDSLETVSQLNRLLGRVKHASVRQQIDRALTVAAENHGLTRGDLEDMAVPKCELTEVGSCTKAFGDYTAKLHIRSTSSIKTEWLTPAGKVQKSVPKTVKESFANELKKWKTNEKLIKQTLAGQRDRLEMTYQTPKSWTYAAWKERVVEHPILGWFARRLVWTLQPNDASAPSSGVQFIWHEDAPVNSAGQPIGKVADERKVCLWHPIESPPDEVAAWRDWMITHEITQPFKQAYREVYILTDAERNTDTYSNRFAAHIIKQSQFRALCHARSWHYDLMSYWDSGSVPTKTLPAHGLRVEFWVDQAGDAGELGQFEFLATDQVRFYSHTSDDIGYGYGRSNAPLHLELIPPLVFSEVLRDVDLFVGVASVGNDPNWHDTGADGRYREYWQDFSFGELSSTAKTRRELLERLVPRLKIADRCRFDDKFLIVRGDIRTYKIHLGSSNILMEPNDQYLCIVTAGRADDVFLPFEGDQRLSVILSKAMLLAEDKKIKDTTIVSQIQA